MLRLPTATLLRLFIGIMILISITACNEYDKKEIHTLLDARDLAVSTHDIKHYDALLLPGYHDQAGQSEFDIVSKMNKLFAELKRRNIFRVAGVYAVVGWILMQVAALLENSLNLPAWFDTVSDQNNRWLENQWWPVNTT